MYDALCERTHAQLLAGICPWCGREITQIPRLKRKSLEPRPTGGVQIVQVQLPKSLEVEEHVDIRLDDDEPGTVAEALLVISSEMELQGFPSSDIFVIHMAVEGAAAVVRKQGKTVSTIVGCSIETDKVFIHFKQ